MKPTFFSLLDWAKRGGKPFRPSDHAAVSRLITDMKLMTGEGLSLKQIADFARELNRLGVVKITDAEASMFAVALTHYVGRFGEPLPSEAFKELKAQKLLRRD